MDKKERKAGFVHLRRGFSDVNGISPMNTSIQLYEFDDNTRIKTINTLYDLLKIAFSNTYNYNSFENKAFTEWFCKDFLNDVLGKRNHPKSIYVLSWEKLFELIDKAVMQAPYNEVLDIIEYICVWLSEHTESSDYLFTSFNKLFEEEFVGYRFIKKRIVPISDDLEIESIEKASNNPFEGCRIQIQKSIDFLADRETKDYKNSIKESISAVESICQIIVKDKRATLGDALKRLENNGIVIHPSLKKAFSSLYGYTSDKGGIRHAEGMFESEVSFEEAKYMLVSCCAFINYLIELFDKGADR